MKTFNYINNEKEKKLAIHHATVILDNTGDKSIEIYIKSDYMIIYKVSKNINGDTENQIELPYSSLKWIKDSIINGFWKKPSEGGLPKNIHACRATFDNEDILISRSMNAGYPGTMQGGIVLC